RGCRQRRARSRAGTTFSRQIRLGQVRSSSAQDLVLLLQQPNAALGLAQFLGLRRRGARLDSGFDVGLADPLLQRHGVDTEVGGDLLESLTVFTVLSDADNVVAELLGIGLGHNNILPGRPGRASQIRCHLLVHQPLSHLLGGRWCPSRHLRCSTRRRPADENRSFGWYRAEIVGALVNGGFLLIMAMVVIVMAAMRMNAPVDLPTTPMLWAAAGGLLTEMVALSLIWKQSRSDMNVRGALWHIIQTFVGSLLIIVTALVIK